MFVKSYLDTAAAIIGLYEGKEPLATFLKKYFAEHKRYGSRDRRQIGQLVFCYFRTGRSLQSNPLDLQLLAALFLCSNSSQPILYQLKPEWNEVTNAPLADKVALLKSEIHFDQDALFPFLSLLSPQVAPAAFTHSFLVQPETFLRIRPGKKKKVLQQLDKGGIAYQLLEEHTIAVLPAARLDDLLVMDKEVVVQDRSSQQVLSLLQPFADSLRQSFSAWDCCAASGGKSILLHDLFPAAKLTVSDIRTSILANLRKRFERAGIDPYKWFVGDVSNPNFEHNASYDLVICDAPCSGSGTWARTPEWLYFFTEDKLAHYVQLQQKIAGRASRNVRPGGFFLYITCSVFEQENEAIVAMLQQECGLEVLQIKYFTGYEQKADTLFAALLRR